MIPIKIVVAYKIPSLNVLLKMGHMARHQERKKCHLELMYGLQATAANSSTPIISSEERNILLTACATLESYLMTAQIKSASRSARLKSGLLPRKEPKSK